MMKNDDMCDNTFDDTYDDFHCASYIFNHANDTFDDGRDDKKNFFSSAWPTGRREALTTLWR